MGGWESSRLGIGAADAGGEWVAYRLSGWRMPAMPVPDTQGGWL